MYLSVTQCILGCTLLFYGARCAQLEEENVTGGSVVKLYNKGQRVRLHSHDIKYGSGSGQQSVTGMNSETDANSYWQVRSPSDTHIPRGEAIKCGQAVRLTHIQTSCNLHSHHVSSPLSHEQEVSCYGEEGEGDHLDDWIVICSGKTWKRDQYVRFKHRETSAYLACSGQSYGRPIHGQKEIMSSTSDSSGQGKYWKSVEGVYIKPSENMGTK
ncbi:stromal cell-derived factor 2-like [Clavelina lepadiformis]|uniref:MIR domain-containing protein n=1 Tax=Clavelina lepadiformis TaxID=159417 RepID=A0ABP0GM87_CLALP